MRTLQPRKEPAPASISRPPVSPLGLGGGLGRGELPWELPAPAEEEEAALRQGQGARPGAQQEQRESYLEPEPYRAKRHIEMRSYRNCLGKKTTLRGHRCKTARNP